MEINYQTSPTRENQDVERYFQYSNDRIEVIQHGNLDDVFKKAKIQLSVYSTTFYDAIGYNIHNFALIDAVTHNSYIREMIDSGVAAPIHLDQDPIELFLQAQHHPPLKREDVYDTYPTQEVLDWINQYILK